MKLTSRVFFFLLLLCIATSIVGAAPGDSKAKLPARRIIHRTAAVLIVAQQSALQGQKFAGLGLAVAHHRYSRKLFAQGAYEEAIYHSLRARLLGANIIKVNSKSETLTDALYDRFEEDFAAKSPPGEDLDKKLPEKPKDDKSSANELIDSGGD